MSALKRLLGASRSWGLLAGSLVLGFLAFGLSAWYLQHRQLAIENELMGQQGEKQEVVVALRDLQPGTVLSSETLAVAAVPVKHMSANAVTPDQFSFFDGKVLTSGMSQGEVLLNHFVAGLGAQRFSDLLQTGERAVTIPVDEIKSNDNMLTFGDRVDLLLLTEQMDDSAETTNHKSQVLNPLVENVRVLAVGRHALVTREADLSGKQENDPLSYGTLTVGVPIDDASRLLLGRDLGTIVVMLRNREDKSPLNGSLLDKAGLLAGSSGMKNGGFEFYSGSQMDRGVLRSQLRPYARKPKPRVEEPDGAPGGGGSGGGELIGPPAPSLAQPNAVTSSSK